MALREASKILEENEKTLKKNMQPNGIEIGNKNEKMILRWMCYADDTCLIVPNRRAAQLLCKTVEECCKKYGLSLNASKTQMIATSTFLDGVEIDGVKLKAQKELKYLGKIISIKERKLNTTEIRKKIWKKMFAIKKIL
uniref:Reverse transcriptase domain-containing protein n=1 Tax=Strongyloides papillosus TaxID=174720 RepID=A0A0N5C521_STREA